MALSDKNILITPSVGAATDPTIRFVGADASSSATITLRVLNTGTVGTLSFEGNSGQLFSLSDTMSGTIFSVNDISGIPSIEVIDTGEIRMAQYGGFVDILSATSATSTNTGALQVVGGVGIGGSLYVGGIINGNLVGSFTGVASTATNIAAGTAGQVPYQTAPGVTAFVGPGTAGQILLSAGTSAPVYTNTSSIYVGAASSSVNLFGGTAGQIHYQSSPGVTAFVGPGTAGQILLSAGAAAPVYTNTASIYVGAASSSVNLFGGTVGQVPYQTAAGATSFYGPGTAGQLLVSAGAAVPVYTNTSSIYVGASTISVNLFGGTAGQIHYQSAAGVTAFAGPGTAGQLLVSAGAAAPVYTNTSSIYVGAASSAVNLFGGTAGQFAYQTGAGVTAFISTGSMYVNRATIADSVSGSVTTATNIAGGTAGQIHYQSAPNTTAFAGPGTAGQLLVSAGAAAPVYTNTASIYVQDSNVSTNIRAGLAGQLHYQSAPNTTAFVNSGTSGQFLQATTNGAPAWTNTGSMYVNRATIADSANSVVGAVTTSTNIAAGTAGQVPYQTAPGLTGFYGPGTAGQLLVSAGTSAPAYTNTSSIYVGAASSAANLFGGTAGQFAYQTGAGATAFVSTSSMYVNRATIADSANSVAGTVNTATNIAGGTAGQIHYQSAPNTTAFAGPGTAGQLLVSAGTSAPVYTNTASIYVQDSNVSTNIRAGLAGQINYQSAPNTTAFVNSGTSGQFLQATTNGAPAWTNTGSMYVNRATVADSATGASGSVTNALTINSGGSGSASGATYNRSAAVTISYNSIGAPLASQSTNGAAIGSSANSIFSSDTRNNNFTPGDRSAGLFVDFKANATDGLTDGGTYHGVLTFRPYGVTNSDFSGGNAQQLATTDGNNLWRRMSTNSSTWGTWYKIIDTGNTSTAYVNRAVIADSVVGGSGQINTVAQTANASYFPTFVDSNNASATAESVFTTSTFAINPSSGDVSIKNVVVTGYVTATSALSIYSGGTNQNIALQPSGTGQLQSTADVVAIGNNYNSGTKAFKFQRVENKAAIWSVPLGSFGQADIRFTTSDLSVSTEKTAADATVRIAPGGGVAIGNTYLAQNPADGILLVANTVGIGTPTPTSKLHVVGDARITGITTVTNTTAATSTVSGALQVAGGAGVGGDLYVGGSVYSAGAKVLPTSIQEFTATGGQTSFTVTGGYTVGTVQVFANGIQLANADFTASNGTTVVVVTPRISGDIIRTVSGLASSSINNINALAIAYSVAFGA